MKSLKKATRNALRIFALILGAILLYVTAAFCLSRITVNADGAPAQGKTVAVYIKTNGVHTDILVPVSNEIKDWSGEVRFGHTAAKDATAEYLGFGWGDRDFYLHTPEWSDLKARTAFNAAFYLGTSVMHTQFYKRPDENENCKKILISTTEYEQLAAYISKSFAVNKNGALLWIPKSGYRQNDTFYEAKGKYSLFKTCNTWANDALKSAGQKAALWTATDGGIFCHYRDQE